MPTNPIVFLGTGEFAVPTLNALHGAGERIALVVTQPDRPRGRGRKLAPTPVKEAALLLGLEVFQPEDINAPETVERIEKLEPEFLTLVDYGQLLKAGILGSSQRGPVNLHPSLLPKYRGPAPVAWAVLNGDKVTGVSTMFMDAGMDTGAVLMQEEVALDHGTTRGEASDILAVRGAQLMVRTLAGLRSGEVEPTPQDGAAATYSSMIGKELINVDWTLDSASVAGRINALSPKPGARASLAGKLLKPLKAVTAHGKGEAGAVISVNDGGIVVACGQGAVTLLQLLPEGRKMMSAGDFIHGGGVKVGMVFDL